MYPIIRRKHHWEVPTHFTPEPGGGSLWRNLWEGPEGWFTMSYPVDMREEGKNLVIEAELPGFSKDQVNVSIEDNVLHLRAERESSMPEGIRHITERTINMVERHIHLPAGVDETRAEARMTDGVLRLTIPKKKSAKEKEIPIK